jgi:DNA-binding transcriptional LysR family regulator
MQLDVESLRTLLAVLDHGSMTVAARQLQLSQSAVSWKIKRLEERVGRPLLVRDGRSLRPTRDARLLVDEARIIVEAHDRAVARLRSAELSGKVRLGTNEEIAAARLVAIVGRFNRVHPHVTVEVTVSPSDDLLVQLDRGGVDVVVVQIGEHDVRPDDTVLWIEELTWATSRWADHSDGPVPLVTFGDACQYRRVSEPVLDRAGIDHYLAFAGQTTAGVHGAVVAGLGVAVLGDRFLDDDIVPWERGNALGELPRMYQVVRANPRDHDEVAAALIEALSAEVGAPGPIGEVA